jgi:hypothetical protein
MENDPGLAVKLIQGELLAYVAKENRTVFQSSHVGHFSDCRSLEEVRRRRAAEAQTGLTGLALLPITFLTRLFPHLGRRRAPRLLCTLLYVMDRRTHVALTRLV